VNITGGDVVLPTPASLELERGCESTSDDGKDNEVALRPAGKPTDIGMTDAAASATQARSSSPGGALPSGEPPQQPEGQEDEEDTAIVTKKQLVKNLISRSRTSEDAHHALHPRPAVIPDEDVPFYSRSASPRRTSRCS
jgi:hypothetical protein